MWCFLFWAGFASVGELTLPVKPCRRLTSTAVHGQTVKYVSNYQFGSVTYLEFGSDSISVIGVGTDGFTTYVDVGVKTLAVDISGTTTSTEFSSPFSLAYTRTFAEGASGYMISTPGSLDSLACAFGANGQATCVDENVNVVGPGSSTTAFITYSGLVEPLYTFNAGSSSSGSASSSGSSNDGSLAPKQRSYTGAIAGGIVGILALILACIWFPLLIWRRRVVRARAPDTDDKEKASGGTLPPDAETDMTSHAQEAGAHLEAPWDALGCAGHRRQGEGQQGQKLNAPTRRRGYGGATSRTQGAGAAP
ncbi:hypothetical protein B0H13DRAFT_2009160 [Mycena leptocephala]|nr:hypothetical protein B0H13DRAFT_2009160 [Mycena leptocephala]